MEVILGLVMGIGLTLAFCLRRKKAELKEKDKQENRIARLVESSKDVIYYYQVKPEYKFKYISPSLDTYLGKGVVKAAMENPYDCFERSHPDDVDKLHNKVTGNLDFTKTILQRWQGPDGQYLWFEEYATPVYEGGQLVAVQGIIRNIDEKIKLQEDLEYRVNHDGLTGIFNRSYFEKQAEFFNSKKNDRIAIILCDLDNLKKTNDSLGHKQGDKLIIETARVLASFSSKNISASRIGGDEFAILINGKGEEEVFDFIEFIESAINRANLDQIGPMIEISIGCAYSSKSLGKMEELMSAADANMYQSKRSKKELVYS
ncbi:sensor domain-containing diguanylate cyclase [Mesobacillus subterraneus]|uniref:Diguanylate cyclase n=1 Tax=Mesobacillus subterraneus TaxID=285983 RepID=A0A427TQX6_9BACI|nr:diguanylate cyclase [Mesobacillus subterraneus]RSD26661.1 diguanylate cyclase [Mesobacillus subterraneus]